MKNIIKTIIGGLLGPNKILWRHAPRNVQAIALTFDDGPHPVFTPIILDQLQLMGAKATFFLVGEHVEKYPEIVRRIISEGHEVGCHSHTHLRLSEHALTTVLDDLRASDSALAKLGVSTQLFRPPYGNMPWRYLSALWNIDKKIIFWSIDSRDFELESADKVLERVNFRRVVSGDILLFHDCHQSTVDALPEIGRLANKAGLEMITISSLVKG